MNLKNFMDSANITVAITLLIITLCSANPIPAITNDVSIKNSIKASDIDGCMKANHSHVEFYDIKVTGLNDSELRDHQSGNVLTYSELIVSGYYKDEYHPGNKFLISLPNVRIIIQINENNTITNVTSPTVKGEPNIIIGNEALKKCISKIPSFFDDFASTYVKSQLINKIL